MNICVVCQSFPTQKTIDFVFIEQLCREFADLGENITVIAPQSVFKSIVRRIPLQKTKSIVQTRNSKFTLLRPYSFSFGNGFHKLNKKFFDNAVLRACRKIDAVPDVLYGHFWCCADAALPFALKENVPLFVVAGEGEISSHTIMTDNEIKSLRDAVNGVICVSTKSKKESVVVGFTTENKCTVIPNAINPALFYPREKRLMREKLNLPQETFILAFVGQFNSRKGVARLCEALKKVNNLNIKIMFMGTGAELPDYEGTIFAKTVNHDDLPEYLSAADAFILPSINEGCSNAIIEAMACGLPILSSDMEFNHDVLNEFNSILFDPLSVDEIAQAILNLYSDSKLCEKLSKGALVAASKLTIHERAKKILAFIKSRLSGGRIA
jgi:glycosyltransferase involved in cell wall biosynthesis